MSNTNKESNDFSNIKGLSAFRESKIIPLLDKLKKLSKDINDLDAKLSARRNAFAEARKLEEQRRLAEEQALAEQKANEERLQREQEEREQQAAQTVETQPAVEAESETTQGSTVTAPVETPVAAETVRTEQPQQKEGFQPVGDQGGYRRVQNDQYRGQQRDGYVPRDRSDTRGQRPDRNDGKDRRGAQGGQGRPYGQNNGRDGRGGYPDRNTGRNQPISDSALRNAGNAPTPDSGKRRNDGKKTGKDVSFSPVEQQSPKKKVKTKIVGGSYNQSDFDENGEIIERSNAGRPRRSGQKQKAVVQPQAIVIEKAVITTETVAIKVLSEKIGKSATEIVSKLFSMGILANINGSIDAQTAQLVAMDFNVELEYIPEKSFEDKLTDQATLEEVADENAEKRPPVITIMGHVDHGKTSLLDYIRNSNVAGGEAGGITQHIGAYTVSLKGNSITFLDTPGHAAFTAMRARGAQMTDIAVIVVAVEDGVMPQTVEAINHARQAGVAIIIAINKIDKLTGQPDKLTANVERLKNELSNVGIVPTEWGGNDEICMISAKTGEGVEDLLETILYVAEILDLKANPHLAAKGSVVEAQLDKNRGPLATILVQNGTLRVGDYLVAGTAFGKVKAMHDSKGCSIREAGPSTPVVILGFSEVPNAGDVMQASKDEKLLKQVVEERKLKQKEKENASANEGGVTLADVFSRIASGSMKELNIILKTDVQGSVEAIKKEIIDLSTEEVKVSIIHSGVGAINETDIMLAETAGAIVVGFNVRPDSKAKALAERNKIDVRCYRIIYDIKNDLELALKGMLDPKFEEKILGKAVVRQTFRIPSIGTIAGCYVEEGIITRNAKLRLLRDNIVIHEGEVSSLKRLKDDVKEVKQGYECGIGILGYNDIKVDDYIEFFVMEQIEQ